MKNHILPAFMLTACCIILFSVVYTFAVWGVAWFGPNHGKGKVVSYAAHLHGYPDIAQSFTQDKYFWSRPSATGYNASGSGGSNKGPSNPEYIAFVDARIDSFVSHNPGIERRQIPSELVTASGSGLDPNLSSAAAMVQVKRIARVRNLDEKLVRDLVDQSIDPPLAGFLGTSKINVLKLNIALDELSHNKTR